MDRLWAMEVFVRVAECGSFSKAAQSLDLANATVTTCVRNLERHLGVVLINRDTRRLRLTEEGQGYLMSARSLLESMAKAEEQLRSKRGELSGRINVEITISLGHALLSPRLPEFARRYPEVSAAITLGNQPHNLIERAIDVAIRVGHVEDADLVARPICDLRYVVCCTPQMASRLPTHPGELDRRDCIGILPEERYVVNPWELSRGEERVVIVPAGALHFNTGDALLMAARDGIGVACVLDVLANSYLDDGSLVRVYPEWSTAERTLYMVTPKSRVGSAKVKAFADFVLEVIEAHRRPDARRIVGVKSAGRR